ncbi:hypothetical protein L3073_08655 [Ancylomarina sp. DW003]|nr:hypothetical protein [Ancylomarina sp. DW003]MDE5422278.1 hypothetical protein [Ancylomarina sp. DW003]
MKSNLLLTSALIIITLGFNSKASGQPTSKKNIKTIINGKVWIPKVSVSHGDQFFLNKMNLKGDFLFDGHQYQNIEFTYDLSKDIIITRIETEDKTKRSIVVNPYLLEGFSVHGTLNQYNFLRGGLIHKKLDPLRYYQAVEFKNLKYVVKRTKYPVFTADASRKYKYVSRNHLYLISDNNLFTIKKKKDIIRFFPNKKKEIKRFIRKNKLTISSKTPMDAVVLLSKFDQ